MSDSAVVPMPESQPPQPADSLQQHPATPQPQAQPTLPQYIPPQSQSQPLTAQYAPQVSQSDMVRALAATKSYYGAALWTLALYWFTFWIGGAIANVIYLNSAKNAEQLSGASPEGKGCLWILLITHFILPLGLLGLIMLSFILAGVSQGR